MAEYTIASLPETHRKARDILRRRWSDDVDDTSPAWTVTIDSKCSVVAFGSDRIVVITPGFTGSEFALPMNCVQDVPTASREVAVRDRSGWVYRLVFDHVDEAVAFAGLAQERGGAAVAATVEHQRALEEILVVTTDSVPGAEIVQVHGDVFGVVVRARNVFSNIGASVRTVVGGEAVGYTKLLTESRNQARGRLAEAAVQRGANAVVAMRYDTAEVADLMSEVTAYGTAVTIRPKGRDVSNERPRQTGIRRPQADGPAR